MHGDDVVVLLDGDDDVDAMARVDSATLAHNKTPGACSWQSSIVELNNSDAGSSTEAELVAKSKKKTCAVMSKNTTATAATSSHVRNCRQRVPIHARRPLPTTVVVRIEQSVESMLLH